MARSRFNLTESGIKEALIKRDADLAALALIDDPIAYATQKKQIITELKDLKTTLLLRFNAKKPSWILEYHADGDTHRKKVGTWPLYSIKDMRAQESDLLLKAYKNQPLVVSHFKTIADLIRWGIEQEQSSSTQKSTKSTAISIMNAQLLPRLGAIKTLAITKVDVQQYLVKAMKAQGLKDSSIKAALGVLKNIYSKAFNLDLIEVDPVANYHFKQFEKTKIKPKAGKLPPSKLGHVISQLNQAQDGIYLYVLLLIAYGTRKTETAAIRWDWINTAVAQPCLILPADITKTSVELTLPLSDFILHYLAAHQQYQNQTGYKGPYLFPHKSKRGPITQYMAHKWVLSVSQKQWTAHDLRKLFSNSLITDGVDSMLVNMLLNHAQGEIDSIYMAEEIPKRLAQIIDAWHAKLKKFIEQRQSDTKPTALNLKKWLNSA